MCAVFAITLCKVVNFSLKAKPLTFNSEPGPVLRLPFVFVIILFFSATDGYGQVEKPVRPPARGIPVRPDTLRRPDSLSNKKDTLNLKADSLKVPPKGDIETTIVYSARDSINSSLDQKIVRLYGEAKVRYGIIELQAEEIVIDYDKSTITAQSRMDTTGRRVGYPIFINGEEKYETKDMVYNFKSKKAKITEVVTKQGDGFIHGALVFKNEKDELLSINNAYTTCDLREPHFRIISKKSKAIPHDKIVSGPFYMEFNGVPTPLGFAFGIFPSPRKSSSGIIVPSYGEERRRGFFLRHGGYFFDINEYINLTLTGDLYSKGGSSVSASSVYNKRYRYTGSFNFSFSNNVNTDNIESPTKSKDFRLTWSHTPQTKGTGRFSASVNAATTTYNVNNFLGVGGVNRALFDQTTQTMSSNVNYSKTFPGTPFSLGVNLRHSQNLTTKQVDLPMPDVSFNVNNIYPFKRVEKSMVLQNLNVRYTMNGTNQITNNLGPIAFDENGVARDSIAPFNFDNLPLFLRNSKKGIRHSIPISTSFKILKFFTLSPSINYDERWYFDKLNWSYYEDDSTQRFTSEKIQEFNRVFNYSGGVSMTTRIYGMYLSKNPNAKLKAIRHVVNPTVGYSFQPDFSDPKYGYYQRFTTTDNLGRQTDVLKARHEGYVYGTAPSGRSSALNMSINNNIEMKVRTAKDTVDRKIALFNTLSVGTSYNFLADSFNLAPLAIAANTNILQDKINLNFSATLDPYEYRTIITGYDNEGGVADPRYTAVVAERRFSRLVWNDGKLGRITRANFAFSTNLNPKGQKSDTETREKISNSPLPEPDKQFLLQNPDLYVDFSVPWNLRISYNVDYTHGENQNPLITQAIRFSGDLSLTEKWKITYNSGYDFQSKEFTQTQFSINRDLHCWQMSLGWTPFGRYQSYNFSIGVKSTLLRDLKIDRNRSFFDNIR